LNLGEFRSATEKVILEDLYGSVFKKCHPSGNLKFNYLGISQSLKLHILIGKILSISLKLNFTPNTLGCFGLYSTGLANIMSSASFSEIRTSHLLAGIYPYYRRLQQNPKRKRLRRSPA